jgi:hypothetical protein
MIGRISLPKLTKGAEQAEAGRVGSSYAKLGKEHWLDYPAP